MYAGRRPQTGRNTSSSLRSLLYFFDVLPSQKEKLQLGLGHTAAYPVGAEMAVRWVLAKTLEVSSDHSSLILGLQLADSFAKSMQG